MDLISSLRSLYHWIAVALLILGFASLSSCSPHQAQNKVQSYSSLSAKQLGVALLTDASRASQRGKEIAFCQARVITHSQLPEAVINVFIKNDGRSVVQKARDLKRFHLAGQLKTCVSNPRSQG